MGSNFFGGIHFLTFLARKIGTQNRPFNVPLTIQWLDDFYTGAFRALRVHNTELIRQEWQSDTLGGGGQGWGGNKDSLDLNRVIQTELDSYS